ncbi:coiled-coil domain-containing protein 141 isoform X2 [Brienomyrus brachyistius]|uniref:coiled-coil domain-containing protein 141 isoform X2 n=1 Tax=Brienomyrus brachyistius TaxID=42636 RepID=UPI0020B1CF83|nr:coiled-coil domain-containing protein 141 isoform X2 [Brienomyrus brachyistius]
MSHEGELGGQLASTAISSIAVQAGGSRITVAVLQCGTLLQLQLAESEPDLLEIGNSQEDTQRLLEEHEQLLIKLKKHEGSVRGLLEETDRTMEVGAEPRLHEHMASSLSQAWKELVAQLDTRRDLLQLAICFYDQALEFAVKIDEAEELQLGTSKEISTGCLEDLVQKHSSIKRGLLKTSLLALNSSQELVNFLQHSCFKEKLLRPGSMHRAHSSCTKVENLLEILQDRRRQVDQRMRQQQHHLESILHVRLWEQQEQEDRSLIISRLLAQAPEVLSVEDREVLAARSLQLMEPREKLWRLMEGHLGDRQESNNKAFEALAGVESQLQAPHSQSNSLLAQWHKELQCTSREVTSDPLQHEQLLLERFQPHCAQMAGVLGCIQVNSFSGECHAYQDLAEKKLQLMSSIEELIYKVSLWMKGTRSAISNSILEPGSGLSESEDMLNRHKELASQAQDTADKLKYITELVAQLRLLDSHEADELSSRNIALNEQLGAVMRSVNAWLDTLRPYVCFLHVTEEVDEQIQQVQEIFKGRPEDDTDGASGKWQSLLQKFLNLQEQANIFICSVSLVSEKHKLDVKAAVCQVEKIMEKLTKKKAILMDLWTSWQLQVNQIKSVKKQWKKFKEHLKKTIHDLKMLEDVLAPGSKMDLGSDLTTVTKLQENFNLAKPQFMLNAEVEHTLKISELLPLRGASVKEKNEKVMELLHVHQQAKDKIKEYEVVLCKAVRFLQLYHDLDCVPNAVPVTVLPDASQARVQLAQYQERRAHMCYLYKQAISLGAEVASIVCQSHTLGFQVQQLQERMKKLETASMRWSMEAYRCEENLESHLQYCVFKEEMNELRDSFKDLRKKFNNLKFSYMKRNEKIRNIKAVKNQSQQIERYMEKLQVLKNKVQALTIKLITSKEQPLKGREMEDAVNELQRQLGDFDRTMEEFKTNLEMTANLQQVVEEYQFWSDEASATIMRVGKYSSECKTKEAVSMLYKQFEKFVWPTIPQQEERIQQIKELAIRLLGPEEGKKFAEKAVSKHSEIVDSIKELCKGLMGLETKLQAEALKQQSSPGQHRDTDMSLLKESCHTPENAGPSHDKRSRVMNQTQQLGRDIALLQSMSYCCEAYSESGRVTSISDSSTTERLECLHTTSHTETISLSLLPSSVIPGFSDIRGEFCKPEEQKKGHEESESLRSFREQPAHTQGEVPHSAEEIMCPDAYEHSSLPPMGEETCATEGDLFTEEYLSNDEYECPSPDDISLPPLSETPESNMVQSENEDGMCSHSPHASQQGLFQFHSQFSDGVPQRQGLVLSHDEGQTSPSRFRVESSSFVHSPLTVPTPSLVSSTLSSILNTRLPPPSLPAPSTLSECQWTLYAMHESFTQMQECAHVGALPSDMHVPPSPLTDLGPCRPAIVWEEVRLLSGSQAIPGLSGQAPYFSKLLSNAKVMEGSPVTLEVEVVGSPEPTLTWWEAYNEQAS